MTKFKTKWIKLLLVFVVVMGSFAVNVPQVNACSCIAISPEEEFMQAAAVFVGEVQAIEIDEADHQKQVQFDLFHTWKGEFDSSYYSGYNQVTVATPLSGSACGYNFSLHEHYLVYARGIQNQLLVSSCSNTKPLLEALSQFDIIKDNEQLATPKEPTATPVPPISPLPTPTPPEVETDDSDPTKNDTPIIILSPQQTERILTGDDIGFKVVGINGDRVEVILMVRINGKWMEADLAAQDFLLD